MDNQQASTLQPTPSLPGDIASDVAHITQEMYKKNAELAGKNKTLSLLQTIDEIILSSVTDPKEIAQQVTNLLVKEAEFAMASILVFQKERKVIERIGLSEIESIRKDKEAHAQEPVNTLSITQTTNIIVQAILEGHYTSTTDITHVALHPVTPEEATRIQQVSGIKSFLVFPLIVRGQVLGGLCIGHVQDEKELSDYQKDLLGRLVSMIGIAIDNALLYNELQQANEKLKALDKLKDEFVSLASHELRTPMTAIKSYLWMALAGKGGALSEKLQYYLGRAYNSTDRLIKLVNDMLNISRIESGRITIAMQSVKIDALVAEVIEEIMPRAQELGIVVSQKVNASLPDVLADPDKIKEVLINLIGNALKFTPKSGTITVFMQPMNDMVQIQVVDNGIGLDKDDLPKLFQKFGMLEGSYVVNQNATQGTGLGLYICKSIIELHGGTISVTSEGKGKGAQFTFYLRKFVQEDVAKFSQNVDKPAMPQLEHTQV